MKFRALLQEPQYIREFHNIILTLSKLTKECVIQISSDKIHFIANEESGTTAPLVWIAIDANQYFPEYTVEGVDADQPHIMLAVSPANLSRALGKLRTNASNCKLKLIKIQFSCLRIEADVVSQTSDQTRRMVDDVPVRLIPRVEWDLYSLPTVPSCKLVLNVPSMRLLRGLIDKMKNLSPTITLYLTSAGEINLVCETEQATLTTRYKNLEPKVINPTTTQDKASETVEASCSVDCKKCSLFFSSLQVPTGELFCGIDDDRLIHMEVNVRQGVAIHSILPAVCM